MTGDFGVAFVAGEGREVAEDGQGVREFVLQCEVDGEKSGRGKAVDESVL